LSWLFKILLGNLPTKRIRGKLPKSARDPDKFMRLQSAAFAQILPENASLSKLHDVLLDFVRLKTRTSRKGLQMLENAADRIKCALKWEGFFLHDHEAAEICATTVLEYYACASKDIESR
jgi:hypothetical protein